MANLPKLPPDRVYFCDIKNLLGISSATLRRRYRPWNDATARNKWTVTLDIRENAQGYLHCSKAAVDVLVAESKGGPLATGRSIRSNSLQLSTPRGDEQKASGDIDGNQ